MVRGADSKSWLDSSLPETDEIFTSALTEQSRETVLLLFSRLWLLDVKILDRFEAVLKWMPIHFEANFGNPSFD
jgi:hypothetical protein